MTPSNEHQHSYKRVRGTEDTYRCLDPHCTHFATSAFIEGNAAACASCGEEFVVNHEQLRRKRVLLKCENCKTRTEFGGKVREDKKPAMPALDAAQLERELRKIV